MRRSQHGRRVMLGGTLAVSPAMRAVAARLSEATGIQPLAVGERRPAKFYVVDHYTGKPIVPVPVTKKR